MNARGQYERGDIVRSLVNAQGLVKGAVYEVVDRRTTYNVVGGFTSYDLDPCPVDENEAFARVGTLKPVTDVGNGHLILSLVYDIGNACREDGRKVR